MKTKRLLNVGCGRNFHPEWVNADLEPAAESVIKLDALERLPFDDGDFEAVYSSHLLEHLSFEAAPGFIRECRRVMAPGGILRIVVPDLEEICRKYLDALEQARQGEKDTEHIYNWMKLELLDQMVREESGGMMGKYLAQPKIPAEEFVAGRMGEELRYVRQLISGEVPPVPVNKTELKEERKVSRISDRALEFYLIGKFRSSGEVHKWMYDSYSLRKLFEKNGFTDIIEAEHNRSRIPGWKEYLLDSDGNKPRKPDSLYMEGVRST